VDHSDDKGASRSRAAGRVPDTAAAAAQQQRLVPLRDAGRYSA
jgi:hypothetical protein